MKLVTKLALVLGLAVSLVSLVYAPVPKMKPAAVLVTCKTPAGFKTPTGVARPDYVSFAGNCDQKQLACDQYKDDPFYGPAQATTCEPIYHKAKLKGIATKHFKKGRRYPGPEKTLTMCKTKQDGIIFAQLSKDCSPEEQKKACDFYGENVAEPSSCKTYTSFDWVENELKKNPIRGGLVCYMPQGSININKVAPDCSAAAKEWTCPSPSGEVTECKIWDDAEALQKWAKTFAMEGYVTCKIKNTPIPSFAPWIPARDCGKKAQRDACGKWGTPMFDQCQTVSAKKSKTIK